MKSKEFLDILIENNKTVNANIDSICVFCGDDLSLCKFNEFDLHELRSASKFVVALCFGLVSKLKSAGGGTT